MRLIKQELVTSLRHDHVTSENHYISITTVHMAAKFGNIVTYLDKLPPVKSHDSLLTWPCEIT